MMLRFFQFTDVVLISMQYASQFAGDFLRGQFELSQEWAKAKR